MFEIRKRINRIKIKLGYRLGFSKAIGMPKLITIDPTNHCNLKCPLCPTGLGDTSVEYGLLQLDKFKEVVDVFSKWAQTVQLFSWGEPVLNKSFPEMIRYASQSPHKIRSTTSVNLNATNDEQIKGLLTSNLDALHVSIDGVTQEVYEKYRVGGNLETVFNNFKKLLAAKELYKSNTKIIWDFIVMKQNEHQVEEAKKMAKDFGVLDFLTKPIAWKKLHATLNKYKVESKSKHILIVDDDPSTRMILRKMLIKDGWRVDEAQNGKIALDRMNAKQPELILLDLLMPVMDGFTFLKKI